MGEQTSLGKFLEDCFIWGLMIRSYYSLGVSESFRCIFSNLNTKHEYFIPSWWKKPLNITSNQPFKIMEGFIKVSNAVINIRLVRLPLDSGPKLTICGASHKEMGSFILWGGLSWANWLKNGVEKGFIG